jgi:hypothetical protein
MGLKINIKAMNITTTHEIIRILFFIDITVPSLMRGSDVLGVTNIVMGRGRAVNNLIGCLIVTNLV